MFRDSRSVGKLFLSPFQITDLANEISFCDASSRNNILIRSAFYRFMQSDADNKTSATEHLHIQFVVTSSALNIDQPFALLRKLGFSMAICTFTILILV